MGRIAEALKRAQQERADRLQTGEAQGRPAEDDLDFLLTPAVEEPAAETSPVSDAAALTAKAFIKDTAPLEAKSIGASVIALHQSGSPMAEKYRSARTRLLTTNPAGSARVFAVASALQGEGRSVTTANLGFSLSELRHLRVAMVDMDFRSRGLSRLFQQAEVPGAAQVLKGDKRLAEVCLPVARDNLCLVPAGLLGETSPSDMLACGRMSEFFRELRERFHYTLVDTPPIHEFADLGLIGPMCHSVLMVIRMNKTPEPILQRSVKLLQSNQLPITGCILTGYTEETIAYSEGQDY